MRSMQKRIEALETELLPHGARAVFVRSGEDRETALARSEQENGPIGANDTVLVFRPIQGTKQ